MSRYWQVKTYAGWWEAGPLELTVVVNTPRRWNDETKTYDRFGSTTFQARVVHKHNKYICNRSGRTETDRSLAVAEGLRMLKIKARELQAKEQAEEAESKAFWDAQAERDLAAEPPTEVPRGFRR